jgi:hypothetical protein
MQYGALPDEVRATYSMLAETEIRISEEDTAWVDGTVIELSYNAMLLTEGLQGASLHPTYRRSCSSPLINPKALL